MAEVKATLTLAFIALVAGLAAYAPLQLVNTGNCCLIVENAAASSSADGVVVAVSLRNYGKTIENASLKVGDAVLAQVNGSIPHGKSVSLIIRNHPDRWVCGERKVGVFIVRYVDGSQAAFPVTIPVYGWAPGGNPASGSAGDSTGNHGSAGEPSGSAANPPEGQRFTLFFDTFEDGLNGWQLWGYTDGFIIETCPHGRPAPCLHVCGEGPEGVKVGAAKTVGVPAWVASLVFTLNFNVYAPPDQKLFPGNLWVRIDADGLTLYDCEVYEAKSACSGWKNIEVQVALPRPACSLTLIVYMMDQSSKVQEFWIDNVLLEASGS